MNYNQYPAEGIDLKIKLIQDILEKFLKWDDIDIYGRVQRVQKTGGVIVPEVQITTKERREVYYDDRKAPAGNIFFICDEDDTSKDGMLFTAKIRIVFMLNLEKIMPELSATLRPDTVVQSKVCKLMNKAMVIEVTGIGKELKNIMAGFTIDKIAQHNVYPYHTFSINGNLKYTF